MNKIAIKSLILVGVALVVAIFLQELFNPFIVRAATFTVANTNDSGLGSLRQAIINSNASSGTTDTIVFNIPGVGVKTITPTTPLPTIIDPVIIDGTTQPGFTGVPIIEINGSSAGTGANGLLITAGNSTVKGLVINRFTDDGIRMETGGGNRIEGSYIGTDATGGSDQGNRFGVAIQNSPNNVVGGTTAGTRNVISGNLAGITIRLTASVGNQIQGNFIGTNANGTGAVPNSLGVEVLNATSNIIGGTTPSARNVISGNDVTGIQISGPGATDNLVQGNFIGTDVNGTAALGNRLGVHLLNSLSNIVGGVTPGARNIISGNQTDGVSINSNADDNAVEGNYIGTDPSGALDLGNSNHGVMIIHSKDNRIGSGNSAARNVISGNGLCGVVILGSGSSNNAISGNFIGTNFSGTSDLGNSAHGVLIQESSNNIVRSESGAPSVISGNDQHGIFIQGSSFAATTGNLIQSNLIGTDVTGTADLGNSLDGVNLGAFAEDNLIGPTGVLPPNVISGNNRNGVFVVAGARNLIRRNFIGTDISGTNPLGNTADGVRIDGGADHTVGGGVGFGNTIKFNGQSGVNVSFNSGGNACFANSIAFNGTLGIDVGFPGITENDPLDEDFRNQNFPVLSSAVNNGSGTFVVGTLNSAPNATFTIEFFSNSSCDPSGNGEGQSFLGSILVTTAADGNIVFSVTLPALLPAGQFVTATATDSNRNTSEFSACRAVVGGAPSAAEIFTANATSYEGGTLIEWCTAREVDNLGFNLYRDLGGKRLRVNPELLAGSALKVGSGTILGAGSSYLWWDSSLADCRLPFADCRGVQYWLEDIDLSGRTNWHGPIVVKASAKGNKPPNNLRTAIALSEVGKNPGNSTPLETKAIPLKNSPSHSAYQANLASGPAVKISVKNEGWYRVGQAELLSAGLDPGVDPRTLQLYADGYPIAIAVTGESDGRLDASDCVEFFGVGLDSPSTDLRCYWLVTGSQPGLRIDRVEAPAAPGSIGSSPFTVVRRDKTVYFSALRNGDVENFFGAVIASQPVEQVLSVSSRDKSAQTPASLEVALQGVTLIPHLVSAVLNNTFLGTVSFDGQSNGTMTFSVPDGVVKDGHNVVTLRAQGAQGDVSLVSYIQLTYSRNHHADDDLLMVTATANQRITATGFSNGDLRLFDVTEPTAVREILGLIQEQPGQGFSISAIAPGKGERSLVALSSNRFSAATKVVGNNPSKLRNTAQGADLVVIANANFANDLLPLTLARQAEGLSVLTIDVEDVYDEFGFGNKSPQAIRDFLSFTRSSWKKKPRFALLVGDASLDPKNYLALGDFDFVPTKLVDTLLMEAASDDWLADFNEDGIAELAVGRLPVRTSDEAARVVAKILGYAQSSPADELLMVADANDGYSFELMNAQLRALIPEHIRVNEIRRGQMDALQARSVLLESINRGQRIVNYTGHGSVDVWRGGLFTAADAGLLENQNNLSLFVLMTCLNGYFNDPALESLSETLLKSPNGGAVGVWASSTMSMPDGQSAVNQELYRQIFGGTSVRLGEAIQRAKMATSDLDVRLSWILLGDPTIKVR